MVLWELSLKFFYGSPLSITRKNNLGSSYSLVNIRSSEPLNLKLLYLFLKYEVDSSTFFSFAGISGENNRGGFFENNCN